MGVPAAIIAAVLTIGVPDTVGFGELPVTGVIGTGCAIVAAVVGVPTLAFEEADKDNDEDDDEEEAIESLPINANCIRDSLGEGRIDDWTATVLFVPLLEVMLLPPLVAR